MEAHPSEKTAPPFGRYVIRERMAEGGMGEVFLAVAVGADGFEKPVVIKRLLPKFAGRAEIVSLLSAEAKLMTRLTHPNIVQVIDFGRGDKNDYFVVMELVRGTNLGKFCQAYAARGQLVPVPIALFVTTQVLRGLAYAHGNPSADGQRLVHRDISPGNILLSTFGEVKVADFGVALVGAPAEASDGDGWIVGKPAYMAPEQLQRAPVDERADLYAVGAVLFQAVTGSLHRGEIRPGVVDVPAEVTPHARALLLATASPELAEVVLRALAPQPDRRYAEAREMARAIEQLVETGQKIATADELADVVAAMVESQPTRTKSVLVLSAEDDVGFGSGTELTRIDSDDKHGFTLKIRGAGPEPPASTRTRDEGEEEERIFRPRRRRWVNVGFVALALLVPAAALLSRGLRDASGRDEKAGARAEPMAAAPLTATETTPSPAIEPPLAPSTPPDTPPADKSTPKAVTAGAANRKGEGHPRARDSAAKETAPRESPPPSAPGSNCRGQLHLYATHGWLLSGGPGSVQAPGRYDWPCGTYGLKAVSRVDSSEVRSVTVTIRAATPGIVDLR
jgi:eukaryotic-like serine/threonine-protein kinase